MTLNWVYQMLGTEKFDRIYNSGEPFFIILWIQASCKDCLGYPCCHISWCFMMVWTLAFNEQSWPPFVRMPTEVLSSSKEMQLLLWCWASEQTRVYPLETIDSFQSKTSPHSLLSLSKPWYYVAPFLSNWTPFSHFLKATQYLWQKLWLKQTPFNNFNSHQLQSTCSAANHPHTKIQHAMCQ